MIDEPTHEAGFLFALVAQRIEQSCASRTVAGSSPAEGTPEPSTVKLRI